MGLLVTTNTFFPFFLFFSSHRLPKGAADPILAREADAPRVSISSAAEHLQESRIG